ncbi:hypothetical protein MMC18_007769 [Xylographa bjoerkii]|nr:hypothetical protein [Xylographa bjoerkii]
MASPALKRLRNLHSAIAEICEISGTPGLSYGVVHEGHVLHTDNFGFADIEAKRHATSDTVYYIGSLTKAFTAAAMGVLVEDGITTWETLVHDIFGSDFHFSDQTLTERMSVLDVLSHRMGIQRSNQLWYGNDNTLLIEKSKLVPHIQYLKPVQPFRSTMHYNNWGYALGGEIIEKLSGKSWGAFLEQNLLAPLQMNDTSVKNAPENNLVAKPYTVLDDHSFRLLSPVQVEDGTIMCSSQAIQSTVNDMLKWCQALIKAYNDQQTTGRGHSPNSPIKQIAKQMAGLTPISKPFDSGSAVGMGWVRAQLPTVFGAVGCNPGFVKSMPTVGHGSEEVIIYHQGSMAGYTSSTFLIPNTESAIVVLSNSISLNDCADWVGQMILEALLDIDTPNDYRLYAKESADAHLAKFPSMRKSLEEKKVLNTKPKKLEAYLGIYYNEIRDFFVEIKMNKQSESLELAFQGLDSQVWGLEHYHYDSFLWLMSRDEAVIRSRFPYSPEKLYKLEFVPNKQGDVDSLLWAHDADGPPEQFYRHVQGASNIAVDSPKQLVV